MPNICGVWSFHGEKGGERRAHGKYKKPILLQTLPPLGLLLEGFESFKPSVIKRQHV